MSADQQLQVEEPKQSTALVRVHQVEHTVSLPAGMPATNPDLPRVEVTQEQIDFMVGQAGKWLPSLAKYWPVIVMVMGAVGKIGAMIGVAVNPPGIVAVPQPEPVPAIVKPVETPKAKSVPDLQQMIDDAVKRSLEKTRSPEVRAPEPKTSAPPEPKVEKVEPKEPFRFKD